MLLFKIPDIRLFWTEDKRFLDQFSNKKNSVFLPYSNQSPCYKDISFYVTKNFDENEFFEIARNVAGDLIESIKLVDDYENKKIDKRSKSYRIIYRHPDRSLTNEEVLIK